MPQKRKRRVSLGSKGLAPGQNLKRSTFPTNDLSSWGWVGTEVADISGITSEHILVACGLSHKNGHSFCRNKYALPLSETKMKPHDNSKESNTGGELEDDVIVISDDESSLCSRGQCISNPYCLNYLGQENWEDQDEALEAFTGAPNLGDNPVFDAREPNLPVGLKNLGATCYANASLQVWFRDIAFRTGVYACRPSEEAEEKYKESPIFQLQVTFAALQESTQSVFNPTKLVESLQLRTTEQQDAQEFSKLFMSHLDAEFKKQSIPAVKSLITDQFQGKQVYGTICNTCRYRSEKVTNFLEIEINFENNSKLEDRIEALLQPEILSGDNKYLCSRCDILQDATRYTELRKLPPVLHFSLLRFVYDVSTMKRKKSKHAITFPTILDMNNFLHSAGKETSATDDHSDNLYELRGILLHKGSSAYHGHYEAQVYDVPNQSWFQFNDETVTKIKTPGEKSHTKCPIIDVQDCSDENSQGNKHRINAKKRRRIGDSDDEGTNIPASSGGLPKAAISDRASKISSKDAYMLIYTRIEAHIPPTGSNKTITLRVPPPHALEVVNALNNAHDEACDAYDRKERLIKSRFEQRRQEVMEIYRTWNVTSFNTSSVIVSQQALTMWLSRYRNEPVAEIAERGEQHGASDPSRERSAQRSISMDDMLCIHRRLDPKQARNIKCVNEKAYARIVENTNYVFLPSLRSEDICGDCVKAIFKERLYQIEHPRLVSQFNEICEVTLDRKSYWISKLWLRDWKLMKPKMHVISEGDPGPSAFESHVRCEHDNLSLNVTSRRKISVEAKELLQTLFPSWTPLAGDSELCPVCDALIHISKEGKREIRKRAEEEKAKLRHMHDNALTGNMLTIENEPCALIPAHFVKSWKQWLNRPTEVLRPDTVDNTPFICEHHMLTLDPNSSTDLDSFAIIKRGDWDILETLYPGGPLIAVEKRLQDEDLHAKFIHDVPVCIGCRLRRKTDWITTDITVRLNTTERTTKSDPSTAKGSVIYSRKTGARQSKRLRRINEFGERRRLTISKSMTLKEIKIMLHNELSIPTICQRLFHGGHELNDNAATVASLHIHANAILDLREENEVVEIDDDSDENLRDEGRGFRGTLLGGGVERLSSSDEETQHHAVAMDVEKSCSACTFSNVFDAPCCTICDTLFE